MGFFDRLFGSETEQVARGWEPVLNRQSQQLMPYLDELFADGPLEYFQGDQVADMTPEQLEGIRSAIDYARGGASDLAGLGTDVVLGALPDLSFASQGYRDFATGGPNENTYSTGPDLALIDSLINNDVLNDQIAAAQVPIIRSLTEGAMPDIASQYSGASNATSTRRGVAEGIAQRGANDLAADVAARMRGSAYGQALDTAAGVDARNQAAARGNQAAQLQALGTLGQYGQFGASAVPGMQAAGQAPATALIGAGGMMQGQAQNEINANMQQFNYEQMAPWELANLYNGMLQPMVNNVNTQTTTTTPSPYQVAMPIASFASGLPMFGGGGAPAPVQAPAIGLNPGQLAPAQSYLPTFGAPNAWGGY